MTAKDMRTVYAETLVELAESDRRIVILEADLMSASGTRMFADRFPERTFNVGVAEANMVGIAAGLSAAGKIPFATTFGCFAARRTYDQFFLSANYAQRNVKLVGTDPGITATYNGGTHMPLEDIGIMRNIPGLVVFEPCDGVSLKALVAAAAAHDGSTYMRLHRKGSITVYDASETFTLGRGKVLCDGQDLTIIATGLVMVEAALAAARLLESTGIRPAVIDMHTIKPLDTELVLDYAAKTGAVLTCENHQIINGLGSAVCEVLAEQRPTPVCRIGVKDMFGEVGTLDYLQSHFGLTAENIATQARALLERKSFFSCGA